MVGKGGYGVDGAGLLEAVGGCSCLSLGGKQKGGSALWEVIVRVCFLGMLLEGSGPTQDAHVQLLLSATARPPRAFGIRLVIMAGYGNGNAWMWNITLFHLPSVRCRIGESGVKKRPNTAQTT